MVTLNIFVVLFVSIMFFSMHLGQPMGTLEDTKNDTQLQKTKLKNCGNISDELIQEICHPQHHTNSNKSLKTIIGSVVGILLDSIGKLPEKNVASQSVVFNDCCTMSCIETYIKKWLCTDKKYKPAQLINVTQSNETKTQESAYITNATSTTTTTIPVTNNITITTDIPEIIETFTFVSKLQRRPYVDTLNITYF